MNDETAQLIARCGGEFLDLIARIATACEEIASQGRLDASSTDVPDNSGVGEASGSQAGESAVGLERTGEAGDDQGGGTQTPVTPVPTYECRTCGISVTQARAESALREHGNIFCREHMKGMN